MASIKASAELIRYNLTYYFTKAAAFDQLIQTLLVRITLANFMDVVPITKEYLQNIQSYDFMDVIPITKRIFTKIFNLMIFAFFFLLGIKMKLFQKHWKNLLSLNNPFYSMITNGIIFQVLRQSLKNAIDLVGRWKCAATNYHPTLNTMLKHIMQILETSRLIRTTSSSLETIIPACYNTK